MENELQKRWASSSLSGGPSDHRLYSSDWLSEIEAAMQDLDHAESKFGCTRMQFETRDSSNCERLQEIMKCLKNARTERARYVWKTDRPHNLHLRDQRSSKGRATGMDNLKMFDLAWGDPLTAMEIDLGRALLESVHCRHSEKLDSQRRMI